MKLLLVFNPAAGHGRAARALPEIEARCEELNLEVDVRLTERKGHAVEIVRKASFDRYDGVIAGGGDGTVFETVNGLFRNPAGAAIPLGVVPVGTGNSFSRDIGLTSDRVVDAVEVITKGRTRSVDVGHCRAGRDEFYYLNILGVGFVTDVTAGGSHLHAQISRGFCPFCAHGVTREPLAKTRP